MCAVLCCTVLYAEDTVRCRSFPEKFHEHEGTTRAGAVFFARIGVSLVLRASTIYQISLIFADLALNGFATRTLLFAHPNCKKAAPPKGRAP